MDFATTSSGLIVPADPMAGCAICGEEIPKRQLPDHAEKCYREHEDEIQEQLETRETEPWNIALDPEKESWARERGVKP